MVIPRRSLEERFWEKVVKGPGCWGWLASVDDHGYGAIGLTNSRKVERAHRVSWAIHRGPIPKGKKVLHHCDNPPCTRPDHLFLGTQTENVKDMDNKGRRRPALGERNWNAKLTDGEVLAIRDRFAAGETRAALAKAFGVLWRNVHLIVNQRIWKHI